MYDDDNIEGSLSQNSKYRLGHGDIIPADGRAAPFRVETLHMHKIRVVAVACGKEHTVALGDQGKVSILSNNKKKKKKKQDFALQSDCYTSSHKFYLSVCMCD